MDENEITIPDLTPRPKPPTRDPREVARERGREFRRMADSAYARGNRSLGDELHAAARDEEAKARG